MSEARRFHYPMSQPIPHEPKFCGAAFQIPHAQTDTPCSLFGERRGYLSRAREKGIFQPSGRIVAENFHPLSRIRSADFI